ncbi:hypothetical protein P692DRAFT_20423597 [Suillus brevipes Sb2]|nr:hypothetical protein P692DRAFT_20423597 [Suillus brevipes Sb2]
MTFFAFFRLFWSSFVPGYQARGTCYNVRGTYGWRNREIYGRREFFIASRCPCARSSARKEEESNILMHNYVSIHTRSHPSGIIPASHVVNQSI